MAIRASDSRGFSLLELLLTLVIIGLITSLAGLGVSSGSRPYRVDAALRNFADVAEYALDEAQMSGADMGLFSNNGKRPLARYTVINGCAGRNGAGSWPPSMKMPMAAGTCRGI